MIAKNKSLSQGKITILWSTLYLNSNRTPLNRETDTEMNILILADPNNKLRIFDSDRDLFRSMKSRETCLFIQRLVLIFPVHFSRASTNLSRRARLCFHRE